MTTPTTIRTDALTIGPDAPLCIMAGLCIVDDFETTLRHARSLAEQVEGLAVRLVFKSSFDKANRTAITSYRGPGMKEALDILHRVKSETGLPLLTDVHETWQVEQAAEVVDVIQIPAFLCRQTDLLVEAARSGRLVNVKKGQFVSPNDMQHVVTKLEDAGTRAIALTERGTCFGYNTLVNDFRGLPTMRALGYPVIFDATHSVQMPSAAGGKSTGDRSMIPHLARAAAAVGVDGFFFEVHEDPSVAKSDADNALRLEDFGGLVRTILRVTEAVKEPTSSTS